jgi:hypothetical protein
MILSIHDSLTIEDLQERFSLCFPHLKIEFYKKPHRWKAYSSEKNKIDPKSKIEDIRKKHNQGELEIKSFDLAGKVEQEFRDRFGLYVQIYRNENGDWLQTTSTDSCSLNEQGAFSEHAKTSILPKSRKQIDEYRFYL